MAAGGVQVCEKGYLFEVHLEACGRRELRKSPRVGRMFAPAECRVLDFLGDPEWPDQKIDYALEKCGFVALNPVTAE